MVPGFMLRAYIDSMGKLRAEEALNRISETAAGSGTMEPQDQRSYRSGLLRQAGGQRATKMDPATARAIGIGVSGPDDVTPGGVVLPAGVRR